MEANGKTLLSLDSVTKVFTTDDMRRMRWRASTCK